MKTLSACVLLIVLLASSSLWLGSDPERAPGSSLGEVERQMAALGMRKMLRTHAGHSFSSIVIGQTDADGFTDFRGQITVSGQAMPAYGRVRGVCSAGPEQPECWELVSLEANGQPVDLAAAGDDTKAPAWTAVSAVGAPPAPARAAPPDPVPIVMAATRNTAEPLAPDPRRDTVQEADPGTSALPAPTHRVARAVINTRGGPGTEHAVVTRLGRGAALALLEDRDGWGRFVVLDGADEGRQVWAALTILDAVAAEDSP